MYGYAELRLVKHVEDFGAEFNPVTVFESEVLVQSHVNIFNARRSEGVARPANPVRQIAVKIIIAARYNGVRLPGLERAYAGKLPAAEYIVVSQQGKIPDEAVDESVSHVEVCACALGPAVETVFRQRERSGQIEYV